MTRRATQGDVARLAGVSRALVSIAFRGVPGVSDETRDRIFRIAETLDYAPNLHAANLAGKSAESVGIFLLNLHNELFGNIFDGVRSELESEHRPIVIAVGSNNGASEAEAITALVSARVGVIIAAGLLGPDTDVLGIGRGLPVVVASRRVVGIDSAYSDDAVGAQAATRHLISLGHRRILHLGSPRSDPYTARRDGYTAVMREAGLQPEVIDVPYEREGAATIAAAVLARTDRPTAIFANNDQAAFGVLDAMVPLGLRCPDDLSLVGYDDISASSLPGVGLTTVDILGVEIGRRAAGLARRRLERPEAEPRHVSLIPQLVVRRSTRSV